MEEFNQNEVRSRFSNLGLRYLAGAVGAIVIQLGFAKLIGVLFPTVELSPTLQLLVAMLPLMIIVYPLWILFASKVPKVEGEKHSMTVGQMILAFIMSFSIMYFSNLISNLVTTIIGALISNPVENVLTPATAAHPIAVILLLVICAPVFEEIIFRKILIDRLSRYGEGVAIVLAAAIFGLFHFNIGQGIYAFALGLFWGFIYTRTRKIQYTMILHMLINFYGMFVSLRVLDFFKLNELVEVAASKDVAAMTAYMTNNAGLILGYYAYLFVLIGLAFTGAILLIVKRKKFFLVPAQEKIPKGKGFSTAFCNLGIILFTLLCVAMCVYQLLS